MEYYNTIKFTMENEQAAKTALTTIKSVLNTGSYNDNYMFNTASMLANDLHVEGSQITGKENEGYFTPEDIDAVMLDVLKAVAAIDSIHTFVCEVINEATYSAGNMEADYKDGFLNVISTYYPEGYCEYLYCPECGEEVVLFDEYDPNQKYYCPECGEEIDLSSEYEESKPAIENITLKIN